MSTATGGPRTFEPVELVALSFPGEDVPDDVLEQVAAVAGSPHVRLVDVVVVRSGAAGTEVVELVDLGDRFVVLAEQVDGLGLAADQDLDVIADRLPAGGSALVLVVEHVWATDLALAVRRAGAVVVAFERIPAEVVNAIADLQTS